MEKFLGVYYEWVHDKKGPYVKVTMEKDVDKLAEGCKKFIGGGIKVQKTPGYPGTT